MLLNRADEHAKVTSEILDSLKLSGRFLFDLLLPSKTRAIIETTTVRSLMLHLDDELAHIPWELLFDGKQFLCRQFAMGRMISKPQLPTSPRTERPRRPIRCWFWATRAAILMRHTARDWRSRISWTTSATCSRSISSATRSRSHLSRKTCATTTSSTMPAAPTTIRTIRPRAAGC